MRASSIWWSKFKNINFYSKFSKFTKINILVPLSKLIACHFGWASGLYYYHFASWCSLFLTYLVNNLTIKLNTSKTALNLSKEPSIYYIKLQRLQFETVIQKTSLIISSLLTIYKNYQTLVVFKELRFLHYRLWLKLVSNPYYVWFTKKIFSS